MKSINFSDVKEFMGNGINRLFVIVIIFFAITISQQVITQQKIKLMENSIKKAEKKVDFRYFNTTRTLEEIHHVKIDTKNGELK
ncbi:MAG: hypothetical protein LBL38_02410 [Lactobacillales bacterium]|jgi:hypothetical protein|nr:hypothetical protein [Lactobacillales bacterium]